MSEFQRKLRVLIVEDEIIAATVAKRILSDLGCEVDVVPDGRKALQLRQAHEYECIFMSIGLPDIDGYEITKRIRESELDKEKPVPIIALTADADPEDQEKCLQAGMNLVLLKPLDKEKAKKILDSFIPARYDFQKISDESEEKVFDLEFAKNNIGGEESVVRAMLALFADSFPEELTALEDAYKNEDWFKIYDLAHKLKGGSSYCGTMRLKTDCDNLGNAIRKNQGTEMLHPLFNQLIETIQKTNAVIRDNNRNT